MIKKIYYNSLLLIVLFSLFLSLLSPSLVLAQENDLNSAMPADDAGIFVPDPLPAGSQEEEKTRDLSYGEVMRKLAQWRENNGQVNEHELTEELQALIVSEGKKLDEAAVADKKKEKYLNFLQSRLA